MICTEKDASERWCPQVRHVPILDEKALSPANRFGPENKPDVDNPTFAHCIGSRCMLWVWVDYDTETVTEFVGFDHSPSQKGRDAAEQRLRDGWEEYDATPQPQFGSEYRKFKRTSGARRRGTCGLIHMSAP